MAYAGEMNYLCDRRGISYDHFEKALALAEKHGDKQTCLRCTAYLATRETSADTFSDGIRRQLEIIKNAEEFGDPRLVLVARRLLAESHVHLGRSTAERQEGLDMLRQLMAYAQDREIIYETERLRSILKSLSDNT